MAVSQTDKLNGCYHLFQSGDSDLNLNCKPESPSNLLHQRSNIPFGSACKELSRFKVYNKKERWCF
jgi:hypothetical protein